MENITPTALAEAAGISLPYASQILGGKRTPPRSLAIHIFRASGWKHSMLADLGDDDISTLERLDPWSPPAGRPTQGEAAA
jgi:transcriptional regulator with XRE-family HTH domain